MALVSSAHDTGAHLDGVDFDLWREYAAATGADLGTVSDLSIAVLVASAAGTQSDVTASGRTAAR